MTDTTNTDLAQALREMIQAVDTIAEHFCISPQSEMRDHADSAYAHAKAALAAHDAARAQPAPSVADYFDKLRRDDNHHLGLGDVRLTLGQQEDVVQMAARAQPASVADEEVIARCEKAGIRWIPPDDEEGGFPGMFDMARMDEMRRLLAAAPQPPAKESE